MSAALDSMVGACWALFILYWIASAVGAKPAAEKQSVWSSLAHRIPLGGSYFLFADVHLEPPWNLSMTKHTVWTRALGVCVCVLGLFVTLWARWTLAGNWSSNVTFKRGHELVSTGPYRFVRHPIYTGLLVMGAGHRARGSASSAAGWPCRS